MEQLKENNIEENEIKKSKEKNTEKFNGNEVNSKIEEIKNNERLSFNKEQFSDIDKIDEDNPIGETLYMNEEGEKVDLTIDINNETINIGDQTIHINMPKGASLKEVEFGENEVKITGKLGWFSGSGTAEYSQVISSIDDTLEKGNSKIASNSGDIILNVV